MADVLTKEQRSRNMKNIKSSNTKIEVILRTALWKKGFRYRKNLTTLPGKPDIVFTKYKVAVFCDGEFFHGKDWLLLREKLTNSNNSQFWIDKIQRNIERDNYVNERLSELGYVVIRFWGNEIKKDTNKCVEIIEHTINKIKTEKKCI